VKNDEVLISIITVCFNSEKTMRKTIESVLNQNYDNYEYIIVDGGSTDSTVEIIKGYKEKFHGKMTVISEKDKGWYDAMNKGILRSKGEFINILNSDDYYEINALDSVCKTVLENNVDKNSIIYGDSTNIYYNSKNGLYFRRINAPRDMRKISIRNMCQGMCGIRHQSMFVGKNVYKKIGFYNLEFRLHADWDFFLKTLQEEIPYYYTDTNLTYYSMYGISTTLDVKERHLVRKKNKLYKWFDYYFFIDRFGAKTLLKSILGKERWNDLLFFIHFLRGKRK